MLRKIAHRALKERENGGNECSICREERSEEGDWVLEMILELMELGQVMVVEKNLERLIRKARRPLG